MKPISDDIHQKLLALAENRVVAEDIYESTTRKIEEIKSKLGKLHEGDTEALEYYKNELIQTYQHYQLAMDQIAANNEAQAM